MNTPVSLFMTVLPSRWMNIITDLAGKRTRITAWIYDDLNRVIVTGRPFSLPNGEVKIYHSISYDFFLKLFDMRYFESED